MNARARSLLEALKTRKQRKFVEFFTGAAEGNATLAASMAEYAHPAQAGSRLLKNVHIRAAIDAATEEDRSALVADRQERKRALTRMIRFEVDREELNVEGVVVTLKAKLSDWLKAIEMLGRMEGDFIDRSEVDVRGVAAVVYYPSNGRGPEPEAG